MQLDQAQQRVFDKLNHLLINLHYKQIKTKNYHKVFNMFNKNSQILSDDLGYYIYGGVGRGKTMLMKNFFDKLKFNEKFFCHFNSFMKQIHQALHEIRSQFINTSDELIFAVEKTLKNNDYQQLPKVICFDEFQVLDVADAMLLSRIFEYIFQKKIIVIFTSNTHPLELYQNGLQRELFINFVKKILLTNCQVLHLDSIIDYRALNLVSIYKKYLVNDPKNIEIFKSYIAEFTRNKILQTKLIKVWGRELVVKNSYENIAIFNANELFFDNLHSADYESLAINYDLIFINNLPNFSNEDINELRRFTLFVDEIYLHKTALIILAKNKIDNLVDDNLLNNKFSFFQRTISRLKEIKSLSYFENSKFRHELLKKNIA
ncbi:MAG: cell division protein ZapE [Alphaproteobacteria bacterium]